MKFRVAAALSLLLGLAATTAHAEVVLQFGQGGVAGLTDFRGRVGETIDIEVYLTQTAGELEDVGLLTQEFDFLVGGSGGATHQQVGGESTFAFGSEWNTDLNTDLSNGFQNLRVDAATSDFDNGIVPPAGENSILLGTATLDINQIGSYSLDIARVNALSFTRIDLSTISPTAGSATLTAVPEPGTFACLGVAMASGVAYRVRRRRKKAALA